MSRVVLLNLADVDVDVLTQLSRRDPRPEVVVVHPDANALISRLARLAVLFWFKLCTCPVDCMLTTEERNGVRTRRQQRKGDT